VARLISESERRPVRFYLEVGTEEIGPLFGGDPSTLTANRNLRDVLIAKGYDVAYVEHSSGHEPVAWRETLHLGLEELFGR
jgi:enterochelin esterase family protein